MYLIFASWKPYYTTLLKPSLAKQNNRVDSGLPCLTPFEQMKMLVVFSLTFVEILADLRMVVIQLQKQVLK